MDFPRWPCCVCSRPVAWREAIPDVPRGSLFAVRHPACDEGLSVLIAEAPLAECKWCHGPVVWCYCELEARRVPIDPQIVPDGNCVQMLRQGETPGIRFLSADEKITRQGARYWSHMVHCPERDRALAAIESTIKPSP